MSPLSPLELMLNGEKKPSEILGPRFGYTGPEKPDDRETAIYLVLSLAAIGMVAWFTFFY